MAQQWRRCAVAALAAGLGLVAGASENGLFCLAPETLLLDATLEVAQTADSDGNLYMPVIEEHVVRSTGPGMGGESAVFMGTSGEPAALADPFSRAHRSEVKLRFPQLVLAPSTWPREGSKMLVFDEFRLYSLDAETGMVDLVAHVLPTFVKSVSAATVSARGEKVFFTRPASYQVFAREVGAVPTAPPTIGIRADDLLMGENVFMGTGVRVADGSERCVGYHRLKAMISEVYALVVHPATDELYFAERDRILRVGNDDFVYLVADGFGAVTGVSFHPDGSALFVTDAKLGGVFRVELAQRLLAPELPARVVLGDEGAQESFLPPPFPVLARFVAKADAGLGFLSVLDSQGAVSICQLSATAALPPSTDPTEPPIPLPAPTTPPYNPEDPPNFGGPESESGETTAGSSGPSHEMPVLLGGTAGAVAIAAVVALALVRKRRLNEARQAVGLHGFVDGAAGPGAAGRSKPLSLSSQPSSRWRRTTPRASAPWVVARALHPDDDVFESSDEDGSEFDIPIALAIPTRKDAARNL